jgi:hypothetical protein
MQHAKLTYSIISCGVNPCLRSGHDRASTSYNSSAQTHNVQDSPRRASLIRRAHEGGWQRGAEQRTSC